MPRMKSTSDLENAGQAYAAAHAAHYAARDLPLALQLYRAVLASHAGTPEADYSRTQVQNIVNAVIPREELLDHQMEIAFAHFARVGLVGR
jgi:hypothetical protein